MAAPTDILAEIAAYKRTDVDARKGWTSRGAIDRQAEAAPQTRGFRKALEAAHGPGRLALIAEIKRKSPSRGLIREDFKPVELAKAYEAGGAACLSILTDEPSFGGADEFLVEARAAVALPCLRKDFLLDPWQVAESRALGADCILVILAMVDDATARTLMAEARRWGMDALVEVHDEAEMARARALRANLVGVNNRDLHTFTVDLANTERLARLAPEAPCWSPRAASSRRRTWRPCSPAALKSSGVHGPSDGCPPGAPTPGGRPGRRRSLSPIQQTRCPERTEGAGQRTAPHPLHHYVVPLPRKRGRTCLPGPAPAAPFDPDQGRGARRSLAEP